MKNKSLVREILFVCVVVGLIIVTIVFQKNYNGPEKTNILTLISAWISGLATLSIGLISFFQAKSYRTKSELDAHFVDIVVENIFIDNVVPVNVLSRESRCSKFGTEKSEGFMMSMYNYLDNPIFDVKVEQLKSNKLEINYDIINPIKLDNYGKSTMIKNDRVVLLAVYPDCKETFGHYELIVSFKNQFGEVFNKKIEFCTNDNTSTIGNIIQYKACVKKS